MNKYLIPLLILVLVFPQYLALASDKSVNAINTFTKKEAVEFATDLQQLDGEVSDRLIVSSPKKINYMDAEEVATGIEGLYVLQYSDSSSAREAYDYYNGLSYINYVEFDSVEKDILCLSDSGTDFVANCASTANCNIDDAIKLIEKVNGDDLPEIKVGVLDSGIAKTKFTQDRLDGGYSYFEGKNEDGTSDYLGHGTKVAGTIIQNTLDNVRLYSYQIMVTGLSDETNISRIISAIYLASADGCQVINCSFAVSRYKSSINQTVTDVTNNGTIVVGAIGNESRENSQSLPATCDDAISVGAVTVTKKLTTFSNFGETVDIYAIGRNLTSYDTSGNKIITWEGTSAASPVVSSICALLLEVKPNITVSEIKSLLRKTGNPTDEENMNDSHRVIADAYACVTELIGQTLEQTDIQYTFAGNTITFTSNDEDAIVYYCNNLGGTLELAYTESDSMLYYKANLGEPITLKYHNVIACAYSPGKAKSRIVYLQVPMYDYESSYLLKKASATQEYNCISRCQISGETTITVPSKINGAEIQEIGDYCFMGNQEVETIILPETVKQIDAWAFANCPNLKTVIAPGVENCGRFAFYDCQNLKEAEMPNVTVANTAMFMNCESLKYAKLGYLTEIDNHAFYNCPNLTLVKTTDDNISFAERTFYQCDNLTIYAPEKSSMATFAQKNNISLLGNVKDMGGSIRITDPGLRLGFKYEGFHNPNIEEYGFVYAYKENENMSIEDVGENGIRALKANNKIDHGEYTTYNLVFTQIPNTAFNTNVSARAYIKIGDEYFYSDILTRSFSEVANAVINDDSMSNEIKNKVKELLEV